jgi:hypothetical protein
MTDQAWGKLHKEWVQTLYENTSKERATLKQISEIVGGVSSIVTLSMYAKLRVFLIR